MNSRSALYSFIESLIESSTSGDPLFEAQSARNLRTSVDQATKMVRVECFTGELTLTTEQRRRELMVQSTIQCWVLPEDVNDITSLDAAVDMSFEMAVQIHDAIANNPDLAAGVCDSQFREFETGHANLGATLRGVTYLDGLINQAS